MESLFAQYVRSNYISFLNINYYIFTGGSVTH